MLLCATTHAQADAGCCANALAQTIGSSMDDRPTCAAVRKMVQEAVADATEHLEQAAEQQEALAQHDAALGAVTSAAEDAMREAAAVRQAQVRHARRSSQIDSAE